MLRLVAQCFLGLFLGVAQTQERLDELGSGIVTFSSYLFFKFEFQK